MQFNFQYKQVMDENNIPFSKLPYDAKEGIEDINNILKAISMAEKKGKKVNQSTIQKVNRLDKWVALEILDNHFGSDENTDYSGVNADEIVNEIKDVTNEPTIDEDIDANIDVELKSLHDANPRKTYTIEDLKKLAPISYEYIFDLYDEDEENGVETTNYDVSENPETKLYLITKK